MQITITLALLFKIQETTLVSDSLLVVVLLNVHTRLERLNTLLDYDDDGNNNITQALET